MTFLIAGEVGDGAPTHHPERALSPLWWVLVGMGVDTMSRATGQLRALNPRTGALLVSAGALGWTLFLPMRWSRAPGESDAERRDGPVARGLDMRARGVREADITPCSFEHFALIAAWGRPEGARLLPSLHRPTTPECPQVDER
jgi:hypothetical protein